MSVDINYVKTPQMAILCLAFLMTKWIPALLLHFITNEILLPITESPNKE